MVTRVEREKKMWEEGRQVRLGLKERKEIPSRMNKERTNSEFLPMIRKYRDSCVYNPLQDSDPVKSQPITVCIRKRPLKKTEVARKEVDVIWVPSKDQVVVHEKKSKLDLTKYLDNQQFRFDYAFDETCSNDLVYKHTAKPLVENIFDGGMATCFAYGQTGSGKTHTMGGGGGRKDCKKGIYEMTAEDVFMFLESPKYKHLKLIVSASFFEVYCAEIFDLLANRAKLNIFEDGRKQVKILGLTEKVVDSVDELLKLIKCGNTTRISRNTSNNSNPSRAHAILQIVLRKTGQKSIHGKFSLVNLAGNEIGADTPCVNRKIRNETAEINKSLLAVKECIRAFRRKDIHLPFRNSKLTQILRDSFAGDNTKICMIAMINPGISSFGHSLNTLRYANRLKQ
jgi:kinesin family protein 2/24